MKILVITPTFFPLMGGAESGIYEIFRRLAKKYNVRILTPHPSEALSRDFGMEDVPPDLSALTVIRFHDRVNLKNWPGQWRSWGLIPPFSLSMAWAAMREAKSFQPDIVNVFYALPSGLAASRIMKKEKVPVVLSLVGRDIPGPGIPRFWSSYARRASREVTKVIFISEYCRKALFGPESTLGEVIPFGVDTEKFRPGLDGSRIRKTLGLSQEARIIFSLQRMDRFKKVDVLIRAMKIVLAETEAFLVIGGKGPEAGSLRFLAKELGISSRVVFTGYIKEEELPLHFAMADLFVFHSTYETFGLVLVQAMASGKPLVSVNSTAIPEVVEDGKDGRLVPPLDCDSLARAILELLDDGKARSRLSEAARKKVVERFSWTAVSRSYEKIFSDLSG